MMSEMESWTARAAREMDLPLDKLWADREGWNRTTQERS